MTEKMPLRRRGKTFTLKGKAASEYLRAQEGRVPCTDEERALRIATLVHLHMSVDERVAVALIKSVARDGLEAAAAAARVSSKTGTRIRMRLCSLCLERLRGHDESLSSIADILCLECAPKAAQSLRLLVAGGVVSYGED
jgi:hypothetical protein